MKSDGTELVLLKASAFPQAFAVVAAANNDGVSIATRKRQRILFAKTLSPGASSRRTADLSGVFESFFFLPVSRRACASGQKESSRIQRLLTDFHGSVQCGRTPEKPTPKLLQTARSFFAIYLVLLLAASCRYVLL